MANSISILSFTNHGSADQPSDVSDASGPITVKGSESIAVEKSKSTAVEAFKPITVEEAMAIFEDTVPPGEEQEEILALQGSTLGPEHAAFRHHRKLERLNHSFRFSLAEGGNDAGAQVHSDVGSKGDHLSMMAFVGYASLLNDVEEREHKRTDYASAIGSFPDENLPALNPGEDSQDAIPEDLFRWHVRSSRVRRAPVTVPVSHVEAPTAAKEEHRSSLLAESGEASFEDQDLVFLGLPTGVVAGQVVHGEDGVKYARARFFTHERFRSAGVAT